MGGPASSSLPPSDGSNKSQITFYLAVVDIYIGAIIPNATIYLELSPQPNSGGHDHHDPQRPAGQYDRYQGSTGNDSWQFQVTYTAPEVSGLVDTVVTCTAPNRVCYGTVFTRPIEIPGLVPMAAGQTYDLVGSWGMPGVTSQHTGNHYGTPSFVSKLIDLANLHYQRFSSRLAFNDISLPQGGLFDIGNNWRPPHAEHRKGINGDVRIIPPGPRRVFFLASLKPVGIAGTTVFHVDHFHLREY